MRPAVKTTPFFFGRGALLGVAVLLVACGGDDPVRFTPLDVPAVDAPVGTDAVDAAVTDAVEPVDRGVIPIRDSGPVQGMTVVYAHSDTALFSVDPATRTARMVGAFRFPSDGRNHAMTDLAVDAMGQLTGVTQDALYTIDPDTAGCTLVRALPSGHIFVGLTWLPVGVLDPSAEVLLGADTMGGLWRIDPATGRSTAAGTLPTGWAVSGDVVSIAGANTYATVRRTTGMSTTDSLATLTFNGTRVTMTNVGAVGFPSIYGLGYWRATLYGFTRMGELLTINPGTGRGTRVSMPTMQFSGAGVTTIAPTAPP